MIRLVSLVLLVLSLGGCISVSNTIPADQIASFGLKSVQVAYDPNANVWWGDAERAYAASKGLPVLQSDELGKTPEGRAYVREAAARKITAALEAALKPELTGPHPVTLKVTVRSLMISSAIQRVLIGGDHNITAQVDLIDGKTGRILLALPDLTVNAAAGQGVGGALLDLAFMPNPIDRVSSNFAQRYANWLLHRQ